MSTAFGLVQGHTRTVNGTSARMSTHVLRIVAITAVYFVTARLGFSLASMAEQMTTV